MPKYNPDKVTKLISEMRKSLERLETISAINKNEFLKNPDKIDSLKYNFIIAIESAIDFCNHIISQNGYRIPNDYGDAFQVLFEQGAFNEEYIKELKLMAKFRNRLVHIYWEVSNEKIYDFLKNDLIDLNNFLKNIAEFLDLKKI